MIFRRRSLRAMPEDEIHLPLPLAPVHQLIAAEAGIAAQDDPCFGPAGADLPDNALDLRQAAGRGINVRLSQAYAQQMIARENVQGQMALFVGAQRK
jgi:hypothetical protein